MTVDIPDGIGSPSITIPMEVNPFHTHKIDPAVSGCVGVGILSCEEDSVDALGNIPVSNGLFLLFENVASLDVLRTHTSECMKRHIDRRHLEVAENSADDWFPVVAEAAGECLRGEHIVLHFGFGLLRVATIDSAKCGYIGVAIIVTNSEASIGEATTTDIGRCPVVYLVFPTLASVVKFQRILSACRRDLANKEKPSET